MASGAELIRRAKEQITEVDPKEVRDLPDDRNGTVVVDVREQQEFEQSHIPGAKHVPRGHLESRIEGAAKADSHVILYCASGNRSALAAKTLQEELGYEDVSSMTGGITLWKDRGYDVEVPRALTAEQRERYSRHLLVPEIGIEGQLKLLDAKVLLLGAGGLGAPTALYLAAAGVGTIGIVDDDVVDLSNLQRQVIHTNDRIGQPKVDSAQTAINDINPDVDVVKHQTRLDASNIMEIIEGYDIIV
ncbi:MAG: ThiF family adenylyltransferase, partial [Thermoleophilaceae bacterium]|nr:ThiF family adenylyltransferase [Thermoleophilaceae bacterium]